jgi:hypothetical protein
VRPRAQLERGRLGRQTIVADRGAGDEAIQGAGEGRQARLCRPEGCQERRRRRQAKGRHLGIVVQVREQSRVGLGRLRRGSGPGQAAFGLEDFFPCPKPAFGTLQRRSLIPVPDMVFYKDQLEEINEITARIAALTEAVRVRGFYPAGAGEIGDAIEAALKSTTNNQYMVPVSNWAMIGTGGVKDMIVWLPIDVITATITAIIAVRKQLIEDVYEVTGLSDIMRGQTQASETLGAQQLKSQYGSVRIKDKQDELIRVARDVTRIVAEIIAEHYSGATLMDMTQMRLPSDADIRRRPPRCRQQLQMLQGQLQKMQAEVQQAQTIRKSSRWRKPIRTRPSRSSAMCSNRFSKASSRSRRCNSSFRRSPRPSRSTRS